MSVEMEVVSFFVEKGFPLHVAAGIAGNVAQESAYTVHEPGGGLFQFTPSEGMENKSLVEQCTRVWNELRTSYHGTYTAMVRSRSAEDAARIFMVGYERPKGSQPGEEAFANIANAPYRESAARLAYDRARHIGVLSMPGIHGAAHVQVVHVRNQPDPKDRSPKIRASGKKLSETGTAFAGHRQAMKGLLRKSITLHR